MDPSPGKSMEFFLRSMLGRRLDLIIAKNYLRFDHSLMMWVWQYGVHSMPKLLFMVAFDAILHC